MNSHKTSKIFEEAVKLANDAHIRANIPKEIGTTILSTQIGDASVKFTFVGKPTKEHIEHTVITTAEIQTQARNNPYKGNMLQPTVIRNQPGVVSKLNGFSPSFKRNDATPK